MAEIFTQACIFFTQCDEMPGNETLGTVNHCFMIMRNEKGVVYYNSAPGGAVVRFKFLDEFLAGLKNRSPETGGVEVAPRQPYNFPQNSLFEKGVQFFELLPQPSLTPEEKPTYTTLPTDPISKPLYDAHYYHVLNRYKTFLKPVFMIDVALFKLPGPDFFYGKPMHCHNFLIQLLGLNIGNIITSLHFKNRLLEWSGKTNFYSHLLYDATNNDVNRVSNG